LCYAPAPDARTAFVVQYRGGGETVSFGPIELLIISFPGNQFKGEIAPALGDLVDKGIIRIIDIVFAMKDEEGNLSVAELSDLGDGQFAVFDPLVADVSGLLSDDDVQQLAGALENNSSAGLMLFENVWATEFVDAVRNADGQVVLNERIPRAVIEEVLAARQAEGSEA
jgi:hypothetical protein